MSEQAKSSIGYLSNSGSSSYYYSQTLQHKAGTRSEDY